MKKSAFALIAFLALAGATFGSITLSLTPITTETPGAGLTSYMLQATGVNITTLSKFKINIPVYQVWIDGSFPGYVKTQTEWTNNGTMEDNVADSYIVFGSERIEGNEGVVPDIVTLETNAGAIEGEPGATSGWGTLNNYTQTGGVNGDKETWDAYLRTWNPTPPTGQVETIDLMHLVLADDQVFSTNPEDPDIEVTMYIVTTDFNPVTGKPDPIGETVTLPAPQTQPGLGDTDSDGDVDSTDYNNFLSGWFGYESPAWFYGDFDADNDVDSTDYNGFLSGWFGTASATAVPEPGTIVMLILGALCLVGYRVRK